MEKNDVVHNYRKASKEFLKSFEEAEAVAGATVLDGEVNGIPRVIWDSYHVNLDDEAAMWKFMEDHEIANRAVAIANDQVDREQGRPRTALIEPVIWTRKELRKFRGIVRRYAEGKPTAEDMYEITSHFRVESVLQTSYDEAGNVVYDWIQVVKVGEGKEDEHRNQFLMVLYHEWAMLLPRGVELRICESPDCSNIFIPYRPGQGQRFCSARCRVRDFKRRKRQGV